MARITIERAATGRRLSDQDIREVAEKYDLACGRDENGHIVEVEEEALELVLLASDLAEGETPFQELVDRISKATAKRVSDKATKWLTAATAVGALGAAVFSLIQIVNSSDALYAQNRYMAQSHVADAWQEAMSAKPDALLDAILNLDNRFQIVYDLRRDGAIRNDGWTDFIKRYCIPLDDKNYLGRKDLFPAVKAMCEKERKLWDKQAPS